MTKSQLVDAIAARTGLTKKQSADAIDAALETVEDVLGRGGEVTLAGFSASSASSSAVRAPACTRAAAMNIAATVVPKFTAGSALKQSVRK